MKLSHIAAAAGLALASLGAASSADARPYDGYGRPGWHDGRYWGHGGGWHGDRRWHRRWHNRCHLEWRHHHRVRVCY